MNQWLSSAGGIQTVNRKLACALAALDGTFECVAIVLAASDDETENAARNGVRLIRGQSETDWASVLLLKDVRELDPSTVTAIVGHSHFSGQQALLLRDNLFPTAMAVQFVHMSPMHTEPLKEYRRNRYVAEREQRRALELEIAKRADVVACVGPRLHRYMNQQLVAAKAKPYVVRVNCGFERVEGERSIPDQPTILCMGRADSILVKGLDLFAIAAGELTKRWMQHPATDGRPMPEFIVRGAKEKPEALQKQLVKSSTREGGITAKIHVRPYTTSADQLNQDLCAASVFVMPSREEGFGLVACEALSQGVPVVITSESGLAETFQEMSTRTGQDVSGSIVQHVGSDEVIAKQYAKQMLKALVDERVAGQRAHQIFEHLLATNSWEEAAKRLRDAVGARAPAATSILVPQDALPPAGSNAADGVTAPTTAALPAEKGAAAGGRLYDVTETLRRHETLLKSPGIVTFVVRHALVVLVEEGATVDIPDKLDDIDVVVRKIDRLRFSSLPIADSGDEVIHRGGQGLARVGIWVTDQSDNLLLTTVAHAFGPSSAEARVEVRSEATGELLPASVARLDRAADVALLAVPSASVTRSPVTLTEPTLELAVRFVLPGRVVTGVISGVAATLRVEQMEGLQSLTDLFEVRVGEGTLQRGDSGCIVADFGGRPVGFLVATTHAETPGIQRVFAKSIITAFAALGVRPVALALTRGPTEEQRLGAGGGPASSTARTKPRVGILAASKRTLDIVLRSLEDVAREQGGATSYFTGRLGPNGPTVVVHGLESMGNLSAAVTTTNLLREHRLNGLILVGLAGGVPSSGVALGDVVVSSEIIHYEPAVLTETGVDPRFRVVGLTPAWLAEAARGVASDLMAKSAAVGSGALAGATHIHIGAIASGEKLLHSSRQLRDLLGNWGRVLAVEMEGAGVATAVSMSRTDAPLIIVRGIADLMDGHKREVAEAEQVRDAAASSAVCLALALSRSFGSNGE